MIYDIFNPTQAPRIIYDGFEGSQKEIRIGAGATVREVKIAPAIVEMILKRENDLVLSEVPTRNPPPEEQANEFREANPSLVAKTDKPPMLITGMFGIGDNLHQRAGLREVMKHYDVWLESPHYTLYHDLIAQGLKVMVRSTHLRAQAKTLARERMMFCLQQPPAHAIRKKIWYHKSDIDRHGSILGSMMAQFGVTVDKPDFSLPLMPEWISKADVLIKTWNLNGKPLLVYRPIVRRKEWDGESRNPIPSSYNALFQQMREPYFVVSVADLSPGQEWIVGPEQSVDIKLHAGELDFGTMAALFARANMVFSSAGFAPVLAQAVGAPCITIYGGRESSRTTEQAGQHLAPTLGIDPDNPCDCHAHRHSCDKRITLPPAHAKIAEFVKANIPPKPKTLIFATTYIDSADRSALTGHWVKLTGKLNPDCDLMIVDSNSPMIDPLRATTLKDFVKYEPRMSAKRMLHSFPDNVGHLARKGKDGWGRAFCYGLNAAIAGGYDYVVHIEGDSLFRLPVMPIVEQMERENINAASIPVIGTKRVEVGWAETGLMFFKTKFVEASGFVARYNWERQTGHPTPEVVIFRQLGRDLHMMPWKGLRGDKNQITNQNVLDLGLDWVTHCHKDAWVYDRFAENLMAPTPPPSTLQSPNPVAPAAAPAPAPAPAITEPLIKLNLGCGDNKLPGWRNHDADVDISKRLPFADNSCSHILCEHCVEHIPQYAAIEFFKECRRILAPGGIVRIVVPSIEQIRACNDQEYFRFTTKFHKEGASRRGAMHNIIVCHGHQTVWTQSVLEALLDYAGFNQIKACKPGESERAELRNIEGHGKIITKKWNDIESCVAEGTVDKPSTSIARAIAGQPDTIAVVVGGAENVWSEIEQARALCAAAKKGITFFITNSMIQEFPEGGIGVTLHPDDLAKTWLPARQAKGFPALPQVWCNREQRNGYVTNVVRDWGGSVGLFAAKVAIQSLNFKKVLFCGVPMTVTDKHFLRHQPWNACSSFRTCWAPHWPEIKPYARSFSGWTLENLGQPTAEFLAA